MSGGVDSAVAALLLKEAGHRVSGLFMKNWDDDDGTEYCTAAQDLLDAEGVCHRLRIPLHTVNFASTYRANVFAHFLDEYRAGRTPNPDVLCNREIKFKVFAEHAAQLGADFIATGHYARLLKGHGADALGQQGLFKGADDNKDQSYFLHAVAPEQLSNVIFPLGGLRKPVVRDIAVKASLHNHGRKDSTGICFIGERRFGEFLARYLPAQPGPIRGLDGADLGEHNGLMYYTMGQRQGIGIGGQHGSSGEPWYVAGKDLATRTLIVVQGADHPALLASSLLALRPNWLADVSLPLQCSAKTRYRQQDQVCVVSALGDGRIEVTFAASQRAITPGQSVVFYAGEQCLGGAVIEIAGEAVRL